MTTGKRPDFNLTALDPQTQNRSGQLGAAWHQEDGSISIKLNPGTSLTSNLRIRLWPTDAPLRDAEGPPLASEPAQQGRAPRGFGKAPATRPSQAFDDPDDDIPF